VWDSEYRRRQFQKGAKLSRLFIAEIGDAHHVALRNSNQCADPEWAKAMIDDPPLRLGHNPARDRSNSRDQSATKTAVLHATILAAPGRS
jgi:hypothetical protein